jgi:hypothetical protein
VTACSPCAKRLIFSFKKQLIARREQMQVEQMILPDLMEQIQVHRRLWKTFNRDTQLRIIALIGELMSRTIKTDIITFEEGNEK